MTQQLNDIRKEKRFKRFERNMIKLSYKAIKDIEEMKDCPKNLEYFTNVLKRTFVDCESIKDREKVDTIGTYCVMVPEELIYASGAIPVRLCGGNHIATLAGDEKAPRDACPLVRSSVGFQMYDLLPIYKDCKALMIPTTCDGKRKMTSILSKYKKVIPLHVPTLKDEEESKDGFLKDLYALKNTLEKITGNEITYDRLKYAIEAVASAQYEIRRLYNIKKQNPSVIKGTHAMAVLNSYAYDRVDLWADALSKLNDELEKKIKEKKHIGSKKSPRILITGSPVIFPNIKIPYLIEEQGGIVAADETCMGERGLYDPVAVTDNSFEGMMRGLSLRYTLPCTCPSFTYNDERLFKIKQLTKDFDIDGIVYHVIRGCVSYDFELRYIESEMKKHNIPVLRVETDYNTEDVEQLRIRIEAFMEMIKA
ncbi:2-hydroxyacyl-CoA dehydratase family protein [Tepidibacter hydrothermalis]|uniref:2-hydroxyacyl-CoA dehydratase family protein n=1 Tax=Tepidibacter hydrothermalis TaxID=3036126 RepID=A0ABY8EF18_9FIRM|nr:2-hydroxyacyl-CoA dehydratase family protein [Tepidibacter hydrothermalis]WFD10077.1 2-hydroxyacyl-CoA dehydratase family protein [Tepidibacter hydrothermalis]